VTFYHFTSETHLPLILRSGVIMPTESNVSFSREHGGPRVVWLLDSPELGELSHGLHSVVDKTAVTIEVDVPAIRWRDWEFAARMEPRWRQSFIDAGGGDEAADRWFILPAPIRESRWVTITAPDTSHDLLVEAGWAK